MSDPTRRVIRGLLSESRDERRLFEKMTEQQFDKTAKVVRKYVKSNPEYYEIDPLSEADVDHVVKRILGELTAASLDSAVTLYGIEEIRDHAMQSDRATWVFKQAQNVVKALKSKQWLDAQADPPEDQVRAAESVLSSNRAITDIVLARMDHGAKAGDPAVWYEDLTGTGMDVGSFDSLNDVVAAYVDALNAQIPPVSGNFDAVLSPGNTEIMFFSEDEIEEVFDYESVFDDLYPEVVVPRYFAVAVSDYEACATQGGDAHWCTGYGREGEHTARYIDNAPLFVIYADQYIETPPGVASGIPAPGGFMKIAQMYWSPGEDASAGEINDVSNSKITTDKRRAMMLEPFLYLLWRETEEWRENYDAPDDGSPSVIQEEDENGRTWEWDPNDDYDLVHAGSDIIGDLSSYSGRELDEELADYQDMIDALGMYLDDFDGVEAMGHPVNDDQQYYYLLDGHEISDVINGILYAAFEILTVLAPEALEDKTLVDPRLIDEDGDPISIKTYIEIGEDELYVIVPSLFAKWADKALDATTNTFEYDEDDISELLSVLPLRDGIDMHREDSIAYVDAVRVTSVRDQAYLGFARQGESRVREIYEWSLSATPEDAKNKIMEWLQNTYAPTLQDIASNYSKEWTLRTPAEISTERIDLQTNSFPVRVSVEIPLDQASYSPYDMEVQLPYVQWRFNGIPVGIETLKKSGFMNSDILRVFPEYNPFRVEFLVSDVGSDRHTRVAQYVLDTLRGFLKSREFNAEDIAQSLRLCVSGIESILPLAEDITRSKDDWGFFANYWLDNAERMRNSAKELGRSVVNADAAEPGGTVLLENILNLLGTDPISYFFRVRLRDGRLSVQYDGYALLELLLNEIEDAESLEDYVADARSVIQGVWNAAFKAAERSPE